MKRAGSHVVAWRHCGVVGLASVGPASAQVDPLAPLPAAAAQRPAPPPTRPRCPGLPAAIVIPTPAPTGFAAYKSAPGRARAGGRARGDDPGAIVPYLRLNSRAIQLDRAQPGAVGNTNYFAAVRALPPPACHCRPDPPRAEPLSQPSGRGCRRSRRYGVDASVLMAIYGHETSYGAVTGSFDLLEALATLAYEGRRRALFEARVRRRAEADRPGIPRSRLKGSYAGATGYPAVHAVRRAAAARRRRRRRLCRHLVERGRRRWRRSPIICAMRGGSPTCPGASPVRVPSSLNRSAIRITLTAAALPARLCRATAAG